MQVISADEMMVLDANCEFFGLSRMQLMENAGAALARVIRERCPDLPVVVFAGRGNNGGDAFVAARHLGDHDVRMFLLGRSRDISTPEARRNFEVLKRSGVSITEVMDSTQIPRLTGEELVVDAIFGTGIKGHLRPLEARAIEEINNSKARVISVDVPSGMDPDTGAFEKAVRADITVTFHKPKPALVEPSLKEYTGEVVTVPIGIPHVFESFIGAGDLLRLSPRSPEAHKGDAGRILVIGGGPYAGAPALCALAALRCGADLLHVAAPVSVAEVISSFSPNLIVTPLSGEHLCEEDVTMLKEMIPRFDVVAIGMGLGRHPETQAALEELLPLCGRAVVDADGLYALNFEERNYQNVILTPHGGEFELITGSKPPVELGERREVVEEFAQRIGATVLLKGRYDIISNGEASRVNSTGTSGMSVGGTGDVLAGVCAALFATNDPMVAACCAAFINGRAGELAFKEYGYGLTATDVIEHIPAAMRV